MRSFTARLRCSHCDLKYNPGPCKRAKRHLAREIASEPVVTLVGKKGPATSYGANCGNVSQSLKRKIWPKSHRSAMPHAAKPWLRRSAYAHRDQPTRDGHNWVLTSVLVGDAQLILDALDLWSRLEARSWAAFTNISRKNEILRAVKRSLSNISFARSQS